MCSTDGRKMSAVIVAAVQAAVQAAVIVWAVSFLRNVTAVQAAVIVGVMSLSVAFETVFGAAHGRCNRRAFTSLLRCHSSSYFPVPPSSSTPAL